MKLSLIMIIIKQGRNQWKIKVKKLKICPFEYLNELNGVTKENLIGICLNKKIFVFFDEGYNSTKIDENEKESEDADEEQSEL